jgi:hypothetical protein
VELFIDLKQLEELNLDPNAFVLLWCIHNKLDYSKLLHEPDLSRYLPFLQARGFIKISADGIIPRQPLIDLFKEEVNSNNVKEWIQEWRLLWPEGVKTMGRPVRGDKSGCLKKMTTFIKSERVTKDEIFEATKIYVFEKKRDDYKAMTCADYFINKDGISVLSALIEDIRTKGTKFKEVESSGSNFYKEL